MSVRAVVFVIIACCLAGCDTEPEQDQRRPDPVAVYASVADGERFDALVQSFTEETGIRVILKTGDPDLIVKAVIADNGSPPADVLLTADIARAWLAADEGGLRAVQSEQLGQAVAARLRDPENLWFAIGVRRAVIVSIIVLLGSFIPLAGTTLANTWGLSVYIGWALIIDVFTALMLLPMMVKWFKPKYVFGDVAGS